MKKLFILVIAVLAAFSVSAQKVKENDVPSAVKEAFLKQYPNATEVSWEKENNNYEVNFDLKETDHSALFDVNGNLLESEEDIAVSQLPAGVMEYIKTNYGGKKVKEAERVTNADGTVTYEVEVKGKDLIFDSNGKFIKELKDKE